MRLALAFAILAAGGSIGTSAQASEITKCDELAAHPLDPAKVAEGSYLGDIDGPAAEAACREAIAQQPDEPRFMYQLARTLQRQDKLDDAEAAYLAAVETGYPQALYGFASYLQYKPGAGDEENRIAAEYYQRAIDAGVTAASGDLAYLYEAGIGVATDLARALQLYKADAETGDAWSQNAVGGFYADGIGVLVDDVEALKWYRAAVEQGFPLAQYNLGNFYLEGRGVDKDEGEGLRYISMAAAQDDVLALRQLATFNDEGRGLPEDDDEAERLLRRAIEVGDGEQRWQAQNELAWLLARLGKNLEEAADLGDQALAAIPEDHVDLDNVMDTVAWINHLRGDDEKARQILTIAITLNPEFPPYHDRLGDVLAALGLAEAARDEWTNALELPSTADPEPINRKAVEAKLSGSIDLE